MGSPQTRLALAKRRRLRQLREEAFPAPPEPAFIQSLQIEDKVTGGLIPFRLWPFQHGAVATLNDYERVFALKARQLGITWLILAHLLYLGMTGGNRLFLIASQSGSDAIDALHRLRIMYNSLPDPPVGLAVDNTEQIALANGSRFESMKATKRAGRSKAAFAGFADEFAFWDWPEEQLNALDSACQSLYAVTTGNGPGDLAHTIWDQADRGEGRWKTLFIPWSAHPGRDAEWYRLNVTEAPEPRLARREHAATPEDAFAAPGGVYFERFAVERHVRDVEVQLAWPTYRCVDFGYRHPACLWAQVAPSGQVFIIAEHLPTDVTTPEFAAGIRDKDAAMQTAILTGVSYCDPAGKAANVQTAESEFEVLQQAGLNPRGRASSIRDGCVRMMDVLADPELPLVVSSDCPELIRALAQVKPHRSRPELYDFDHELFSHPLDALRYLLINLGHAPAEGSVSAKRAKRDRSGF